MRPHGFSGGSKIFSKARCNGVSVVGNKSEVGSDFKLDLFKPAAGAFLDPIEFALGLFSGGGCDAVRADNAFAVIKVKTDDICFSASKPQDLG